MFPKDTEGFAIDDQYYLGGSGILVKPVTAPGVDILDVYLSDDQASWGLDQGEMSTLTLCRPIAVLQLFQLSHVSR